MIADLGENPVAFWVVEAVATDGPITEERRAKLLAWAEDQNIRAAECRFLSAFVSRADAAARRRLKDLASGTFTWYADELGQHPAEVDADAQSAQRLGVPGEDIVPGLGDRDHDGIGQPPGRPLLDP